MHNSLDPGVWLSPTLGSLHYQSVGCLQLGEMGPKRTVLSLKDRAEIIKLAEAKKLSCVKLQEKYGVGKTQIRSILKNKEEILMQYESSNACDGRKRVSQSTKYDSVNRLVWEWFKDASSRQVSLSGPLIKEKAMEFAKSLDIECFKASNGWLESFKKRHNLAFTKMSGERGDVNLETVSVWKKRLPEICFGYEPKDVFNMDETGLFFRGSPKTTFKVRGEDCVGGKFSKERVTVCLCASMTGEKVKPLVIGRSAKPRCFGKGKANLPVDYCANKKAWMTGALFESWLTNFNKKMQLQGRKVILFLDNAPSHPNITNLSNVKLQFLPPNTTAEIQPMDQGIIQTLKLKYRKRQMKNVISQMSAYKKKTGAQLLKDITILQAIHWIATSWDEVEATTITSCFNKSGFLLPASAFETAEKSNEGACESSTQLCGLSQELFGHTLSTIHTLDSQVVTDRGSAINFENDASAILTMLDEDAAEANADSNYIDSSDTDSNDDIEGPSKAISLHEALRHLSDLQSFFLHHERSNFLKPLADMQECVVDMSLLKPQMKITDFFTRNE